jgi:DNA-binding NarL/FixJ family response regulator
MKVLLVDDHPLILSALQTVIQGLGDDVEVVGAGSAREALATLKGAPDFDMVLLDLQLGDANGFDVLAELRETYPALPVVVVSASDRASDVIRSIDMGAMGFVPKRASNETLTEALRLVMSGGIYVPPMSLSGDSRPASESAAMAAEAMPHIEGYQTVPTLEALGLTARQHDVLLLLLQGKPNKHIARELGLSVETIKDHVAAVLRALGVSSRTQAVLAVSQMMQQQPGAAQGLRAPAQR